MFKGFRRKVQSGSLNPTQSNGSRTTDSRNDSTHTKTLSQVYDFEIALKAMDYLLDDKAEEGTQLLKDEERKRKSANPDQPIAIYPLALGVTEFIEATLGFEAPVMQRAHRTLSDAEAASLQNNKYNSKNKIVTSHIYPPGTEFQVTYAESTLLNALLMLLQENNGVIESAKALFKLRKAYQILDSMHKKIKESEPVFNRNIAKLKKKAMKDGLGSRSLSSVDLPLLKTGIEESYVNEIDENLINDLDAIFELRKARIEGTNIFLDSDVNLFAESTPELCIDNDSQKVSIKEHSSCLNIAESSTFGTDTQSNLKSSQQSETSSTDDFEFSDASESFVKNSVVSPSDPPNNLSFQNKSNDVDNLVSEIQIDNHYLVSTIDEFIHSGTQLCFGILQVVLSLIPPAIGKVLSIVGFKGNRESGLKLLWKTAITSRNIHGELAFLCLLVFYDGPIQFIDDGYTLPADHDSTVKNVIAIDQKANISEKELDLVLKNPKLYIPQLLNRARKHFPNNALWVLQEGRVLASQGKLPDAICLMQSFTDNESNVVNMQQIKALFMFDRATLYTFKHEYDLAARDFIQLIDLNSWSISVYLYFAASCYLTQWRLLNMSDNNDKNKGEKMKHYADLAEHYFKEAKCYIPEVGSKTGSKKGGIGGSNKQLPFDKFVLRKLRQVEARMKQYPQLSYIECFGTSPFHELIYFWNGYNRMQQKELEEALQILGYSGKVNGKYSFNTDSNNVSKFEESEDEEMIRCFLQSIILRSLKRHKEAIELIDQSVISKYTNITSPGAQFKFTKMTSSPYLYPTALYERSLMLWLSDLSAGNLDVKRTALECQVWLKRAAIVADIGDYELSNRTGMRIKAAEDRVEQLSRC